MRDQLVTALGLVLMTTTIPIGCATTPAADPSAAAPADKGAHATIVVRGVACPF